MSEDVTNDSGVELQPESVEASVAVPSPASTEPKDIQEESPQISSQSSSPGPSTDLPSAAQPSCVPNSLQNDMKDIKDVVSTSSDSTVNVKEEEDEENCKSISSLKENDSSHVAMDSTDAVDDPGCLPVGSQDSFTSESTTASYSCESFPKEEGEAVEESLDESLVILDTCLEPPAKKMALSDRASPSLEVASQVTSQLHHGMCEEKSPVSSQLPVNIFSTSLLSSTPSPKPEAKSRGASLTPTASRPCSTPSSRSSSPRGTPTPRASSPRVKDAPKDTPGCALPFCHRGCDVSHPPLLLALSDCVKSGPGGAVDEVALAKFEAMVSACENEERTWQRTDSVHDAVMKEYDYPLLHTAAVSGNVALVRWMVARGFAAFATTVCSPLMQCMLNLDCVIRKMPERIKVFKEMMELMISDVSKVTLDSNDRPTSLLIMACTRASDDTCDRPFYANSLRNILTALTDTFDEDVQRTVLQIRNADGNTCMHELAKLDECIPTMRRFSEVSLKLDIMDGVFRQINNAGKTPLDVAGDAGAIRLVMFLSPLVPKTEAIEPQVAQATGGTEGGGIDADVTARRSVRGAPASKEEAPPTETLEEESAADPPEEEAEKEEEKEEEEEEEEALLLPVLEESTSKSVKGIVNPSKDLNELFRSVFPGNMKAEAKLKILEKQISEKKKILADVKNRMEKHHKSIDEFKSKIGETNADTSKKVENMKVLFEVLLRTQQSIGANDEKVKDLNTQLIADRKTVARHEKVTRELTDVLNLMDELRATLSHQSTLSS